MTVQVVSPMINRTLDALGTSSWLSTKVGRPVTKARIYQLAAAGVLPFVRIGKSMVFEVERLEAWWSAGGAALAGGSRRRPVSTYTEADER